MSLRYARAALIVAPYEWGSVVKILREGDKGTALATDGRGWVPVTYTYRTLRLDKTGVDVPNVLVGVDDDTDEVLLIPSQSTPRLKAAGSGCSGTLIR